MKKLFFLLVALSCVLLNCSKDNKGVEDPNEESKNPAGTTLSLSPQDLVFEAAGGWKEFTINCSGTWTLTGGNAWCQPGATSGSGRSQVKVMAEASTLTSDRNVNLTVRCGSQTKVLAVTQKGVNALTLSKDKFEVAAEGGDLTVTLQANVECTSAIPSAFSSWIKKSPGTKAMTSQSFRYTVSPNEDTQKREGYIVFTGGTKKDTVYVYQSAKTPMEESSLILSEDTYNLSAEAQEITVELKTNIDYEVIVPDTVETWVSHLSTRALRTDKLHFSIAENEGDNARSAVVIIREQGGELTDTLHIRQAKQEPVEATGNFPKTGYILTCEAGSETIEFSVPEVWQASVSYDGNASGWLSLSAESGKAGKAKLTVTATQNAKATLRQAFIDITFGDKKQRLTVTQGIDENMDIADKFDPKFAQALQKKGYINDATHITWGEVNEKTSIKVAFSELTSLKGIEYFTSLTSLVCSCNQLTSLDVSANTALTSLDCSSNQLPSLDVSANTALTRLCCRNNPGSGSIFPVFAWFDKDNIPDTLTIQYTSWYVGRQITLQIQNATSEETKFLTLSQKSLGVSVAGGTVGVTVNTNVEYDVLIPAEAETWISKTSGGSNEIRFTISANEGNGMREAKVIVKARNVELSDTLRITQKSSGMYTGDIRLTSDDEIANFCERGYTSIQGNLIISGNLSVTSLEGLNCLTFIGGNFEINGDFPNLVSFEGLNNLVSIGGDFKIIYSSFSSLISLDGLSGLKSIGRDFEINVSSAYALDKLSSFEGLGSLETIGRDFRIISSAANKLSSFSGLSGLKSIGRDFEINVSGSFSLDKLSSFEGLGSLETIGGNFRIISTSSSSFGPLSSLSSFRGLSGLKSIGGDFEINSLASSSAGCSAYSLNKLSSFVGLESLETIGGNFKIISSSSSSSSSLGDNAGSLSSLSSFRGLSGLKSIGGDFEINSSGFSSYPSFSPSSSLSKLSSFEGLGNLEIIGGNFRIISSYSLSKLSSFRGLSGLKSIGRDFEINTSASSLGLSSFYGLGSLETIGGNFRIISTSSSSVGSLSSLSSFSGLSGLKSIGGDFEINSSASNLYSSTSSDVSSSLSKLSSFEGLDRLGTIGGNFRIISTSSSTSSSLASLFSFGGLRGLKSIGGDFEINVSSYPSSSDVSSSLSKLSSFEGLGSLEIIGGNFRIISSYSLFSLSSFSGFRGLKSIGGDFEVVSSNKKSGIFDYCALKTALQTLNGNYKVSGNAYNPTKEQILNGECSTTDI